VCDVCLRVSYWFNFPLYATVNECYLKEVTEARKSEIAVAAAAAGLLLTERRGRGSSHAFTYLSCLDSHCQSTFWASFKKTKLLRALKMDVQSNPLIQVSTAVSIAALFYSSSDLLK